MPTPKVCRICLDTNVKLLNYDRYELKKYYEQILNTKIFDKDGLPKHFCYMCAAMLYKYHKFKEKCLHGQKIFKELLWKGPITLKSISKIDRHTEKLESSIDIISVSDSVKTYSVKSKKTPKVHESFVPVKTETDSDSSTDDDYHEIYKKKEQPSAPSLELVDLEENLKEYENICQNDMIPINEKFDTNIENMTTTDSAVTKKILDESESLSDEEKILISDDIHSFDDDPEIQSDNEEETVNDSIQTLEHLEKSNKEDKEFIHDNYIMKQEPDNILEKKKNVKGSQKKKVRDIEKKKNKVVEIDKKKKRKKFEIHDKKKTDLDPSNWLKFNLSEEEAIEEFKARANQKRYISAKYKCNDCIKGFSKEDMLIRHHKLRHSESVGPIECRFCHMRFKWKCFLRRHMRQHYTKYKCLRCDLVCPLETTALFHEEYHNGVIRKCAHCDQEFKHLTTYYTHLRTHRSEHVCTLCGASFVSALGLKIHKKIKHVNATVSEVPDEEGVFCKRCDVKFETRNAYEEHLLHSAMHVDGLEDLEEDVPINSNPRKRRHIQTRRLTRIPTDCNICGKHFATQAACRKHHLAEHPRTTFFPPNERHICEICGLSLAPGSVASHVNTHTREKLYSCSTCGREFSSKGGLTTHQLTHTSVKPVACTLCDKRFKQISSMRLHYRTFHLKEPYPKRNRKKKIEEAIKLDDYLADEYTRTYR